MVHALKLYLTVSSKRVGNQKLQLLEHVPPWCIKWCKWKILSWWV